MAILSRSSCARRALARRAHHTPPRRSRHRGQSEDHIELIASPASFARLDINRETGAAARATAKAAITSAVALKRLRGAEMIDLPLTEIVLAGVLAAAIVLALVIWFGR